MAESRPIDVQPVDDCPVQPHVWSEYVRQGGDQRLQLIIHVGEEEHPRPLAAQLLDWVPALMPDVDSGEGGIVVHDPFVLVEMDFPAMFTALLPLTRWSGLLAEVAQLSPSDLDEEISAARLMNESFEQRLSPKGSETARRRLSPRDLGRLRWLLMKADQIANSTPANQTGLEPVAVLRLVQEASARALNGDEADPLPMFGLAGEFVVSDQPSYPIESVSHNRWAEPAVHRSRVTVKADAAESVFNLDCSGVRWAVVDTGIDPSHPSFSHDAGNIDATGMDPFDPALAPHRRANNRVDAIYDIQKGLSSMRRLHRKSLYLDLGNDEYWEEFREEARVEPEDSSDLFGRPDLDHGTHVAGILGGSRFQGPTGKLKAGICPDIRLVDIRVFDADGQAREFEVVVALAFLGWLNRFDSSERVDGVNLSLSLPFWIDNHACGWTPVCQQCDALVRNGVVVVAAAGNSGFDDSRGLTSIGAGFRTLSISDPGNADRVITVGATHRSEPHRHGPISRSGRGPTADGRHKPDLLAPGFEIVGPVPGSRRWDAKTGTSQAAPHVSGVAALLIARYPELRGQPERIKQILCSTATDLGRLVDFQGHGLVDALRALQSP